MNKNPVFLNSFVTFPFVKVQSTPSNAWITSRLNKNTPIAWAATAMRQANSRCLNAPSVTVNTATEKTVLKKLDFPVRYKHP